MVLLEGYNILSQTKQESPGRAFHMWCCTFPPLLFNVGGVSMGVCDMLAMWVWIYFYILAMPALRCECSR